MRLSTLTIATAALVASIASADAMPAVRAGILQCQGGQNVGFVVGSVASLQCVFESEGHRPEPYTATVRRLGLGALIGLLSAAVAIGVGEAITAFVREPPRLRSKQASYVCGPCS